MNSSISCLQCAKFGWYLAGRSVPGICRWGVMLALWDRQREWDPKLHELVHFPLLLLGCLENAALCCFLTAFHIQIITFWLFGIRWRLHIAVCSAFQPFRASTSTVLPCWDYQSCWAVITNQRDPANYTWFEGAPVLTRKG